jgi:hypothetical protein
VIRLETTRGPFRDSLTLFARADEARDLAADIPAFEVVRFRHALENLATAFPSARVAPTRTSTIDLRLDEAQLLARMDAKSCRYEIRKAEKLGDRVVIDHSARARRDFRGLFNEFVAVKEFSGPLGQARYDRYLRVSDVWMAYVDGEAIAGHLLVRDEASSRLRLVFSASARFRGEEQRRLSGPVNRLLHWREMLDYRASGFRTYDFGGLGSGKGPIVSFKTSFGGDEEVGFDCVIAGPLAGAALRAERLVASGRGRAQSIVARVRHRLAVDGRMPRPS